MRNNYSDHSGGGNRFGGRRGGGFNRDRGEIRSMYQVVCDECGKNCEVPFKPSGDRPIYCNDCFEKHKNSDETSYSPRRSERSFDKPSFRSNAPRTNDNSQQLKEQLAAVNAKLDKILQALETKPAVIAEQAPAETKAVAKKPAKAAKKTAASPAKKTKKKE